MATKTKPKMWIQGDILLERVKALPAGAQPLPDLIVQRGELMGHAHRVEAKPGQAALFNLNGTMYLEVVAGEGPDAATLVHEEHGAITLDPGVYKVDRQRQHQPDGWRRVDD